MGIYCTTYQIRNTSVTMGVLKKLRRLDHRTLSMIALFPLRKKHTSIQHSQGKKGVTQFVNNPVRKTQFSFNYWTYWSIFQSSLQLSILLGLLGIMMGPMGVVINVIASFTVDIYIIYHITYIYYVYHTHTYMYRYISIVPRVHPVSQRSLSAWWPWGPTRCCLGWHCHAD